MRSEKGSGCIAWSGNRSEIQAVKMIYAVQLFLCCGLFTALSNWRCGSDGDLSGRGSSVIGNGIP